MLIDFEKLVVLFLKGFYKLEINLIFFALLRAAVSLCSHEGLFKESSLAVIFIKDNIVKAFSSFEASVLGHVLKLAFLFSKIEGLKMRLITTAVFVCNVTVLICMIIVKKVQGLFLTVF